VTLEIPAGALDHEESIGIEEQPLGAPGLDLLSGVYRFEPSGLRFQKDVKAIFRPRRQSATGEIAWSSGEASTLAEVDTLDESGVLSAQINHFSIGAAVVSRRCGGLGQTCCRGVSCRASSRCEGATRSCVAAPIDASGDGEAGASDAGVVGSLNIKCTRVIQGMGSQGVSGVAGDGSGGFFVAGYFDGSGDYGGGVLTSAGQRDAVLARYDASCKHLWSKRFGDAGDQGFEHIRVAPGGDIVVMGYDDATLDLGGGPLPAGTGRLVARFSPDGALVWAKKFVADWLSLDGLGVTGARVVLTGSLDGSVTFGGATLTSAPGGQNVVFVHLDLISGAHVSSTLFPRLSYVHPDGQAGFTDQGMLVAVDSAGNAVLAGRVEGQVDLGGGFIGVPQPQEHSQSAVVVARFDATGKHLWSRAFGGAGLTSPRSVAVDSLGAPIVAIAASKALDFGAGVATPGGSHEVVVKLSSNGTALWANAFPTSFSNGATPAGLAVGGANDVLLTGSYRGSVSFGGPTFTFQSDAQFAANPFIARFASSGSHAWSTDLKADYSASTSQAAALPGGGYVVAGGFTSTINLDGTSYTAPDSRGDAFLIKLAP
jgi:hypothetical protein